MAKQEAASSSMLALALLIGAFAAIPTGQSIGVCYGVIGNNLPSASDVVQLYKSKGITAMRIYFPDSAALQALSGTGVGLVMDVGGNENVSVLAAGGPSAAAAWVRANVLAYPGVSFRYITVGNEVTDAETQGKILPAMRNVAKALAASGSGAVAGIKVSTALRFDEIADSFPPSSGVFKNDYMTPIVQFLATTGAPLLVNVYPYFAYKDDPRNIKLNYATFQPGTTVQDPNGLDYTCLFDAMVDSIYAALEKAGTPDVGVVVSESGWPSAGGFGASAGNAQTYNQNLIRHVGQGTPRKPGAALETYIFAMFNENQKPGDPTERNFGLFNPDKSPAYSVSF